MESDVGVPKVEWSATVMCDNIKLGHTHKSRMECICDVCDQILCHLVIVMDQ